MKFFTTVTLAATLFAQSTVSLTKWDDWAHGRVALEDVSIHFRYAGSGPLLLLIHGNPQYSLTWQWIGPVIAESFTAIAPDNRGAGDSSIPPDGNYSATASAADLKGVLDFLNITETYVFSHDKGAGMAVALAIQCPSLVKRLGVSEYVLPGFGYEAASVLGPYWDLYGNWQLAFFSVPDAADFFIRGREREMLSWYFYHGSYSGGSSISEETLSRYATSIFKRGYLRAMFGPFESRIVADGAKFFTSTIGKKKLTVPTLALGGEALMSFLTRPAFENLTETLEVDIVPKAGHWIEPHLGRQPCRQLPCQRHIFLAKDTSSLSVANLSSLTNQVTLTVSLYGTLRNFALAGGGIL